MTEHDLGGVLDGELTRCLPRRRSHFLLQISVEAQRRQLGGERGEVVDGEQTSLPVRDGIADARRINAHDGESRCHAFDHRKRMDFRDRRGGEDVAHRKIGWEVGVCDRPRKFDAVADIQIVGKFFDPLVVFFLPAADDEQFCVGNGARNTRERLQEELEIFFGSDAPHVHDEDVFFVEAELFARARLRRQERIEIGAVWHNFDMAGDAVLPQNFFHAARGRDDEVHVVAKRGHVCLQHAHAHFGGHERHAGLRVQVVACVIGEQHGDVAFAAVDVRESSAHEGMMHMNHVHCLDDLLRLGAVPEGEIKAGIGKRYAGAANDARFVVLVFEVAEGEHVDFVPKFFEGAFVDVNVTRHAADVGLVGVCHHSDSHGVNRTGKGEESQEKGWRMNYEL